MADVTALVGGGRLGPGPSALAGLEPGAALVLAGGRWRRAEPQDTDAWGWDLARNAPADGDGSPRVVARALPRCHPAQRLQPPARLGVFATRDVSAHRVLLDYCQGAEVREGEAVLDVDWELPPGEGGARVHVRCHKAGPRGPPGPLMNAAKNAKSTFCRDGCAACHAFRLRSNTAAAVVLIRGPAGRGWRLHVLVLSTRALRAGDEVLHRSDHNIDSVIDRSLRTRAAFLEALACVADLAPSAARAALGVKAPEADDVAGVLAHLLSLLDASQWNGPHDPRAFEPARAHARGQIEAKARHMAAAGESGAPSLRLDARAVHAFLACLIEAGAELAGAHPPYALPPPL